MYYLKFLILQCYVCWGFLLDVLMICVFSATEFIESKCCSLKVVLVFSSSHKPNCALVSHAVSVLFCLIKSCLRCYSEINSKLMCVLRRTRTKPCAFPWTKCWCCYPKKLSNPTCTVHLGKGNRRLNINTHNHIQTHLSFLISWNLSRSNPHMRYITPQIWGNRFEVAVLWIKKTYQYPAVHICWNECSSPT